ncbi:LysR substrate-binding domain-containing protein [Pseudomonas sp. S9]|uniref:LysR substrate-binding domain-containing protein n=1 Tax=Pseudomonas sp. S9 TaxID=686578 RepID=UPI00025566A0|nr:LysR substrate-binding domain-containing protein [Pseudomonas sp. S9]
MSTTRLPPLNAVRAFEAAGRLGSYVAASKSLHVTQPAIGRHVRLLEDWLWVQLLQRTSRGVRLTAAGQRYYDKISVALQQIAEASLELTPGGAARWLKILVVPAFAKRWLMPHLDALRQERPGLKVAIEPNPTFTEVDANVASLGIVYGMPGDFAQSQGMLLHPQVFPVCSPAYLETHGPLHSIEELAQHELIHVDEGSWWNAWLAANNQAFRVSSEVRYVSNDHALSMAEAGAGIALANDVLVRKELESGLLVRPLPNQVRLDSYQLLIPPGPRSTDMQWFEVWLQTTLAREFPESTPDAVAAQLA